MAQAPPPGVPPPQAPPPFPPTPPAAPVYPPQYTYAAQYTTPPLGPAPGLRYAGFWIRVVAYLVDYLLLLIPLGGIFVGIFLASAGPITCTTTEFGAVSCTGLTSLGWLVPLFSLASLGIFGLYFSYLWSHGGQSLGQRLCGLHVVDAATGGGISTGRAIGRYVGMLISAYVLDIGLIWVAFDPRKQGWQDKMANTFVVRRLH
ncbi:MAG: RDD family protein [Candidatus Dormibacteria bacterium]